MSKVFRLFVVVCVVVLGSGVVMGAPGDGGPPFRAGEVVVAGQPSDFPGFNAVKYLPHAGLTVLRVETGREWGQIQRFREHGRRAGLNFVAEASMTPNDPFYNPYQWHLTAIQAEAAWDVTSGAGAVVAVLDTGLKTGGADGIGCVSPKAYDVVNGDNDPVDGDGHGTHVSGTIAQTTNNGRACAGMAYGACVMPVKVLDDSGSGSFADIAEGIHYAVDNGADVINMSLGINARYAVTSDPLIDPALDYAYSHGVTVVVAAGNDGWSKNVSYPAIYPTVIAVGATDYNNDIVSYSNSGTGLDVMAPGGDTSTDANGDGYSDGVLQETYLNGAWGYYFFQGTSMASPHVAAVAALLYASGTATTPDAVYQALTSTALDLGATGYDGTYGWGLVQAADALGGAPTCIDADDDGYCANQSPVDCDDHDPQANPGASEVCDGVDNDCDGVVDEGCTTCTDVDGDSFCDDVDCDDYDASAFPGAEEICDSVDNDCDGFVDEGDVCTCAGFKEYCTTDADCCSGNCFTRKNWCK